MLDAKTDGEALRAADVIANFVELLLADPRVAVLFETWGRQSGLSELAAAAARARKKSGHWTEEEERVGEQLANLSTAAWISRLDPTPWTFVSQTLGLSRPLPAGHDAWRWLASRLTLGFRCHVIACAIDRPGIRITDRGASPFAVPPLTAVISEVFGMAAAGELPSNQIHLLDSTMNAWQGRDRATARTTRPPVGRRPKRDTTYLKDAAKWFYALRVLQPHSHLADLAREYQAIHETRDGKFISKSAAESAVRHGAQEAERLLTLVRLGEKTG